MSRETLFTAVLVVAVGFSAYAFILFSAVMRRLESVSRRLRNVERYIFLLGDQLRKDSEAK